MKHVTDQGILYVIQL